VLAVGILFIGSRFLWTPAAACMAQVWRLISLVECAVRYEPVSACISLLTGKLTGNFAISGLLDAISERKTPVPQPLLSKFPAKINREIIFGNREVFRENREICNV
jgi:hypothetical protein